MRLKNKAVIFGLILLCSLAIADDLLLRVRVVVSMSKLNEKVRKLHANKVFDPKAVDSTFNEEIDQFLIGDRKDKALVRTYLEALIFAKASVLAAFAGSKDLSEGLLKLMTIRLGQVETILKEVGQ